MELAVWSVAQVFSYRPDDLSDICLRACFTMPVLLFVAMRSSAQWELSRELGYLTSSFTPWAVAPVG